MKVLNHKGHEEHKVFHKENLLIFKPKFLFLFYLVPFVPFVPLVVQDSRCL